MIRGILSAVIATALWVSIQIVIMHVKPARRRFNAMLSGYLLSLPLVAVIYLWTPWGDIASGKMAGQALWMEWFHAYLLHLLLFFQYVHFFYHVERSVTVRLLVELQQAPGCSMTLEEINRQYSLRDMIIRRLEVMAENGFMARHGNAYHNTRKGDIYAQAVLLFSWIFRSVTQKDR